MPADRIELSTGLKVPGTGDDYPCAYAYQWRRLPDAAPTAAMLEFNDVYTALGRYGQYIFVIPHLDMVVVSTAENPGADEILFLKLLRDHILPAVTR